MSNAQPMPIGRRIEIYEAQRGALWRTVGEAGLTRPQIRRIWKKESQRLKRKALAANARRKELVQDYKEQRVSHTEQEAPASRPCGGTEHCVTASGNKARSTHKKCEAAA